MSSSSERDYDESTASHSLEDMEEKHRSQRKTQSSRATIGASVNVGDHASAATSNPNPFECPSQALRKYAKGPFNPKKPLLQLATKVDNDKNKNTGVVGNGSAIYVTNIILGATLECIATFYG